VTRRDLADVAEQASRLVDLVGLYIRPREVHGGKGYIAGVRPVQDVSDR
jgi:hypothetical protein